MELPALVEAFARTALTALAWGVVQSAILAAAVFLAIRFSAPSATTRHVLWWVVLSSSVVLPLASIAASLRHIEHRRPPAVARQVPEAAPRDLTRSSRGPSERMTIHVTLASARERTHGAAIAAPQNAVALANGTPPARTEAPPSATIALAIWLGSSLFALGRLAASIRGLRRIKRESTPVDDSILRRLRRFNHSARAGRATAVRISNEVDVPVAVGFRAPAILLPTHVVEREDVADIDQIALHEYAHLNRYDDWTNLAERSIERVFWFNPIVFVAARQISLQREIACDDSVIAQTGRAHRYATCLWKLVDSSRIPARPIVAPGALLNARQITIRIEQLLDSGRNARPRLSPFGALAAGLLCAMLVLFQVVRAPAIAVTDPAVTAPIATREADGERQPPANAPTPRPAARAYMFERSDVRIDANASPAAVATAIAAAVAASERAVVKASVTARIRDSRGARTVSARARRVTGRAALEHCHRCDLRGTDLRNRDLHGIEFASADLQGADLRGADLRGATFSATNLRDARMDGADLRHASFVGCDLTGTDLWRASLDGAHIAGTSIRGTNTSHVRLRSLVDGCNGCDLRGLDLRAQDLRGVELLGVDLRDADLQGADLRSARLQSVDLRGAKVRGLKLSGAILHDVTGLGSRT
jgi:uncharacterized protein YjbI with pentapeptide repeats/beta-lactamase regulating signal transducer with metallopeptidase domain